MEDNIDDLNGFIFLAEGVNADEVTLMHLIAFDSDMDKQDNSNSKVLSAKLQIAKKLAESKGMESHDRSIDFESQGFTQMGDLNIVIFGRLHLLWMYARRFFSDLRSYWYLLKKGKFKSLVNFFYTKTLVPTGEGSLGWIYRLGPDYFVRKFPLKAPLPKFVEIETTTLCNKKCTICEYIYWPEDEQVKRHMRFDEFKRMINQFPSLRWVNLTGEGSSFLNGEYFLMLKWLFKKRKTSIWLVDHLADISFEKLKNDVLPYIHGIYVSIDAATKKTYESIKVGCKFENLINNLKAILEYKRKNKTPFPHISFRYVILKENIDEMPLVLDLLNSFAEPHEWGGSSSSVEFAGLLSFPEIESRYVEEIPKDTIKKLLKRKGGIQFWFSHPEEKRNPPAHKCTAWMEPYIMMPGYVLPCCAVLMSNRRPFLRKYSFGNLFKKDFKDIWFSEEYKTFRKLLVNPSAPIPKICVGCRAYRTLKRAEHSGVWDKCNL